MSGDRIPLAGVIGSPVAHSRSPRLHGHWLKTYDLPGHYIPMDVPAAKLAETLRLLPEIGFVGVNITIPHKERVMEIADVVSDRATLIGAANTLTFREGGKIYADNTDGYGFLENLKQGAPDWRANAGPAVVLGAGGASRAVITSLLEAGVPKIYLSNRTRLRAEKLREDFGQRIHVIDWVHAGNVLEEANTVVNTSSLGMVGKPELRVPLDGLRPGALVTDIVYTPLETRLLRIGRELGCTCVDGLGMLLHQAVPGFERWFGKRPVVDQATRDAVL
ncbi:shikimate dehydrogenase [Yangia mangrovi]|uniref:Shikimate dehydrogenase (NADP(+)) n=1 Tax=Alloyangia mangrovi TaxID=1779329 RepID=A0A2A3JVY4_9RHOB|nr:shikimate dehydrogenase [Alloyangia mangrovi]MCA0940266.1 shikimate dehydrogenase [Alloyangia pacifica]MCA0945337.1 shikimate dehydrogenase [Alloyangia pacifica]MCT4369750.1 shikimate dehydrogenase [Alloyangia mangrovi]